MYAYDAFVMAKSNDINNLILSLNQELDKVSKWLTDNQLPLNVTKNNYVIFHRDKRHMPDTLCQLKIDSKIVDRFLKQNS